MVGELLRPVAAVLAQRHLLRHPVDLLLALPELESPGIFKRLVGAGGLEKRHEGLLGSFWPRSRGDAAYGRMLCQSGTSFYHKAAPFAINMGISTQRIVDSFCQSAELGEGKAGGSTGRARWVRKKKKK